MDYFKRENETSTAYLERDRERKHNKVGILAWVKFQTDTEYNTRSILLRRVQPHLFDLELATVFKLRPAVSSGMGMERPS